MIRKALDAALWAPNSSNMQPWEFYWVRTPAKKAALIQACLGQNAAKTAAHLIVCVARVDRWRRNQRLMLDYLRARPDTRKIQMDYYERTVPLTYIQGPLNLLGWLKRALIYVRGLRGPTIRGPVTRAGLFELVTKSTALGCENLLLAITAQGYGACAMEGFDEVRVKRLLGLNRNSHITMVIGMGEIDPRGVYGEPIRWDPKLFVHEV